MTSVPPPALPRARLPEQAGDRPDLPRFVADVARRVGPFPELARVPEQVTRAVVELLGFGVAVLNLTTAQGDLEVVTVAGPPEVQAELLGTRLPRADWDALLEAALPVGRLRFADASVPSPDAMTVWLPQLPDGGEGAWQPEDALFAPLHGTDGDLLGVLSVDLPGDGLRPDATVCELLELLAVQASLALDQARVAARLQRSQELFRRTFEAAPVGMAVFDADRRYVKVNAAYCELLGRPPEELLGHQVREFSHPDDERLVTTVGDAVRSRGTEVRGVERRYLRPDGTVVWGRLSIIALHDERGEQMVLAHVEDVTLAREAAAELERRASSDPLTGLANRGTFEAVLEARLARGDGRLAVLFCDVDRFKAVNDTLGHAAGDALLREVADAVSGVLRTQDLAARLGGDEFVVLLDDVAGAAAAVAVAERVRAAARVRVRLQEQSVLSTLTVGVAVWEPGCTGQSLLAVADRALYRAKALGRDRVELGR